MPRMEKSCRGVLREMKNLRDWYQRLLHAFRVAGANDVRAVNDERRTQPLQEDGYGDQEEGSEEGKEARSPEEEGLEEGCEEEVGCLLLQ
ncbi:MAG TPA: hypothetical protein VMK53_01325 [Gemmatimonadales bacterium]|nr:hypothetical protein [Gemmatimonadales bacterium]